MIFFLVKTNIYISCHPVCCFNVVFYTVLLLSILPLNNNQNKSLDLFGAAQQGPDQSAPQITGVMAALPIAPLCDASLDVKGPSPNIMDSLMISEDEAENLPFLNLLTGGKTKDDNESNVQDAEVASNQVPSQTGQVVGPEDSG